MSGAHLAPAGSSASRLLRVLCGLFLLAAFLNLDVSAGDPLANLRAGHPRLLLTEAAPQPMAEPAVRDPLRLTLRERLVTVATENLTAAPIKYELIGPRLLDQSRKALGQITTAAYAYRLTGDTRFVTYARETMLRAAAFPDWNPSHFLDVAEMATAVALGYDWLYHELPEDERQILRTALLEKALSFAADAYGRTDPNRESFPFVGNNLHNNWNQVCNGGFLLAALALAEEEPELARFVIAGVRETLPYAMEAYEPDGGYPEGPVYWGYGTRYNLLVLAALESALGTDFGLGDTPGMKRTVSFRLHVQSPTGLSFNFADGRPNIGSDPSIDWLGQRYAVPAALALNRQWLAELLASNTSLANDRFLFLRDWWFAEQTPPDASPLALDVHVRGASEIVLFRSDWNDPQALWLGFKSGSNRVNHGHLDLGSFVLDADGVRWALDLGPDDYNLPGYWQSETVRSPRWQYYRLNNLSHNTLTFAGRLQDPDANASIVDFQSSDRHAHAIVDLSPANPGVVSAHRRGIALQDRARVLVQDEVTGLDPATPVTWRLLTEATVQLDGPRRALLEQQGKHLQVEILEPASARFTTRPALPPTAAENRNEGVTELLAAMSPAGTPTAAPWRIIVMLTPLGERWPALPEPPIRALRDW